jgi:hypothetical protein
MTIADGWLLLKKILVGVAITVTPLVIIAGCLWGVQQTRANHDQTKSNPPAKVTYAN